MTFNRLLVEIWSPLPPLASGIADYVNEQLATLDQFLDLSLVVEDPARIDPSLGVRYQVVSPENYNPRALRVYHLGNSPLHGFIYREAIRTPGVVVLHEWNLHELILGLGVRSHDFSGYRAQMRRQHGEGGAIAAQTVASALGGRHWPGAFPLNLEILERTLGVVCLSPQTSARVAARRPAGLLLQLDHHALLVAHAGTRDEARRRLSLPEKARLIVAPGLGTAAKALASARAAIAEVRRRMDDVLLVTVGGGAQGNGDGTPPDFERQLGRVDLETLGDWLVAADVVVALRFPSRGETSGVLMRACAAGRASIVSSGSAADEDLPEGVVARVNPGPSETAELAALLEFLLRDHAARERLERLALALAAQRQVEPLARRLVTFLEGVARAREETEKALVAQEAAVSRLHPLVRSHIESAAWSLGLNQLPENVYRKLSGLGGQRP